MADQSNLESLYVEAQSAMKGKAYDRAAELLTQIIAVDENYKDVSRLLAQAVKLKRRRWYNHPALWWTLGALILVGLGFYIAPRIPKPVATLPPAPASTATITATSAPIFTVTPSPTFTPLPPTPIPLTWKRVSQGQDLKRDTITAIVVDPRDADVIYVGTEHAGVYKTINGAQSWFPAHAGLERAEVRELFIDPQDSNILVAHTFPDEIYRSVDGGATWTLALGDAQGGEQSDLKNSYSRKLIVDPLDGRHFILTDLTGWYESKDGAAWEYYEKKWTCPEFLGAIGFSPVSPTTLFFSQWDEAKNCARGIYQWDRASGAEPTLALEIPMTEWVDKGKAGNFNYPMRPIADFQAVVTTQGTTYVFARNAQGKMFSSADGSLTWRKPIHGGPRDSTPDCPVLTVRPDGIGICAAGGGDYRPDIRISTGDENWRGIAAAPPSDEITALSFFAHQPESILVGSHGFFKTLDNGVTWTEMSAGLPALQGDLYYSRPNHSLYLVERTSCPGVLEVESDSRLFHLGGDGATWQLLTDLGCGLALDADGVRFYRSRYSNIVVSRDGGASWSVGNRVVGNGGITALAAHPVQAETVMAKTALTSDFEAGANESNFYRSTSSDFVWQGLGDVAGKHDQDDALYYAPSQPEILYTIGSQSNVSRTEDGGATWTNCAPVDSATPISASILAIHPTDPDKIYLATLGKGVQFSADGCQSWTAVNQGLESLFVNMLALDPQNPNTAYAGADGGAYVSFDAGATWNQINDGLLGAVVIYSIAVDKDGLVYAATPYGVFKLESR